MNAALKMKLTSLRRNNIWEEKMSLHCEMQGMSLVKMSFNLDQLN